METFSRLNPPDAVRLKVKVVEKLTNNDTGPDTYQANSISKSSSSSNLSSTGPQQQQQQHTILSNNHQNEKNINPNRHIKILNQIYRVTEVKKFCVDPQITSFEILTNLIAQAFGITKNELRMSYLNRDASNSGPQHLNSSFRNDPVVANSSDYITLFNDWDLDAAFLNASNPYLSIVAECLSLKPCKPCCSPPPPALETSPNDSHDSPIHTPPPLSPNSAVADFDEWEVITSCETNKNPSPSTKVNHRSPTSSPKPTELATTAAANAPHHTHTHTHTAVSSPGKSIYNLNLTNKSLNIMNLDPNNGKSSLIALWSNNAADKAVSVFQKMFQSFSGSNSFSKSKPRSSSFNNRNVGDMAAHLSPSKNNSSIEQPEKKHTMTTSQYIPTRKSATHAAKHLAADALNYMKTTSPTKTGEKLDPFDMAHVEQSVKQKQPLGEAEFRNFLDSDGRIVQPGELRQRIFEGGVDAGKRKEIWPILLDVYPNSNMTFKQRCEYLKLKNGEYEQLKRSLWHNSFKQLLKANGNTSNQHFISDSSFDSINTQMSIGGRGGDPEQHTQNYSLYSLAHKIHKDVWRTDRQHKFYAGDSNKNIESLFNILMTYSLANKDCVENSATYAQGMSDLLSPLLYVLKDEALAYWCFCGLIKRCISNFNVLSDEITTKIGLLSSLLAECDKDLWQYLRKVGAEQLLFVYRWLLIECKREFPFNDSLRVLEVMWSTLPSVNKQAENDFSSYCSTNNTFMRSSSNASNLSLKLLKQLKTISKNTSNCFEINATNDGADSSASGGAKMTRYGGHGDYSAANSDYLISNDDDDDDDDDDNNEEDEEEEMALASFKASSVTSKSKTNNSPAFLQQTSPTLTIAAPLPLTVKAPATITTHKTANESNNNNNNYEHSSSCCKVCQTEKSLANIKLDSPASQPRATAPAILAAVPVRKDSAASHQSISSHCTTTTASSNTSTDGDADADLELNFYKNFTRPRKRLRQLSLNFGTSCNKPLLSSNHLSAAAAAGNLLAASYHASFNDHRKSYFPTKLHKKPNYLSSSKKNKCYYLLKKKQRGLSWFKELKHRPKCLFNEKSKPLYKSMSLNCCACEQAAAAAGVFNVDGHKAIEKVVATQQQQRRRCNTFSESGIQRVTKHPLSIKNLMLFSKFTKNSGSHGSSSGSVPLTSSTVTDVANLNLKERFIDKVQSLKAKWSTPLMLTGKSKSSAPHHHRHNHNHHRHHKKSASSTAFKKRHSLTPLIDEINSVKNKQKMCYKCDDVSSANTKSKAAKVSDDVYDYDDDDEADKKQTSVKAEELPVMQVAREQPPALVQDDLIMSIPTHHICVHHRASHAINSNSSTSSASKHSSSTTASAFISASSAVSLSSTCSTPFSKVRNEKTSVSMQPSTKPIPINKNGLDIKNVLQYFSHAVDDEDEQEDDDDQEELIYSLSKLDNPFLLFLCLSLFMESREHIMREQMDANDIACYFDKMTRRHNGRNVLNRARYLYTKLYLAKANVFNYIQQLMEIQNSP